MQAEIGLNTRKSTKSDKTKLENRASYPAGLGNLVYDLRMKVLDNPLELDSGGGTASAAAGAVANAEGVFGASGSANWNDRWTDEGAAVACRTCVACVVNTR